MTVMLTDEARHELHVRGYIYMICDECASYAPITTWRRETTCDWGHQLREFDDVERSIVKLGGFTALKDYLDARKSRP